MSKSDGDKGKKDDSGKPQVSLVPSEAITGMAKAFGYGAAKYNRHNYRKGIAYSRLLDACFRHLLSFNDGVDTDEESGNEHLDHALASLAMLKYMTVHHKELDDRYKLEEEK